MLLPVRWRLEAGKSGNDEVIEGPFLCFLPVVHSVPDGAAVHEDDRMMPVTPSRGGSQPIDLFGVDPLEDLLKAGSRDMVTLIDDHHAVILDALPHLPLTRQGLHDGHIDNAPPVLFSRSDLPDEALNGFSPPLFREFRRFFIEFQKLCQLGSPLG